MPWRRTRPTADRISLLPDAILCHIFSFLPTKHAVATSVLSKRWYPLWRSVTTLHFTYEHSTKQAYFLFKDFVFSVLLLRDITQPIKSFHLKFGRDSPRDFTNINKWVHSVAQQGLQNLHLDFHSYINLPPSILSCKTLVVLKLSCVVVNALPYVDFPLLKILNLDWVMFWEHGFLMKLLSGCPILEDLQTNNLDMYDKHRSEGEVRSLTKLVRADVSNLFIPFTLLPTIEFLRAKLECSYYNDVPEFHSLTHMEIIFSRYDWNWLVGVLNVCPHLQILVLDKDFMVDKKRTFDVNWEDPQIIPECLSSQLRTCTLRNYVGLECELQFAGYIMRNSESLGTMTICSTFSLNSDQKLQILKKLSLCPRRSTTCKLLFE